MAFSTPTEFVTNASGAYASGDVVGGLIHLPIQSGEAGFLLRRFRAFDLEDKGVSFDFYLYRELVPTIADNAAFSETVEMAEKRIAKISVTGWEDNGTWRMADVEAVYEDAARLGVVFCYAVARGAVTYTAANAMKIQLLAIV